MTLNVPKKGPVGYILSNKLQLYKQILHEHKKQAQCCTVFSCYTMLPPSGFLMSFQISKTGFIKNDTSTVMTAWGYIFSYQSSEQCLFPRKTGLDARAVYGNFCHHRFD